MGPDLAVRVLAENWPDNRLCGDETARKGAVDDCDRFDADGIGANWSREGVERSFEFRKVSVPMPLALPALAPRDSRDGVARRELDRVIGSLET